MNLFVILSVLLLLLIESLPGSLQDNCPDLDLIKPCMCDEEGLLCLTINESRDLKRVFEAPTKAAKRALRNIWIYQTNLTSLGVDQFGSYIVGNIYMDLNQLHTIESGAFGQASATLKDLSFTHNKLSEFSFRDLSSMPKLKRLGLGHNKLTRIDANAFPNSTSLRYLDLASNQIHTIGANAFSRLMALEVLDLSHNRLKSIESHSLVVANKNMIIWLGSNQIVTTMGDALGEQHARILDLSANLLTFMSQSFFSPHLGNGTRVGVADNRFTCHGCHLYRWLLESTHLWPLIQGFECANGDTLEQLSMAKIGCQS